MNSNKHNNDIRAKGGASGLADRPGVGPGSGLPERNWAV